MNLKWLKSIVILLCCGILVACSSSQTNTEGKDTDKKPDEKTPPTEQVVELKELVVGIEAEPTSLDPFNSTDGNSATVQSTMFEGLLRFDEGMNIVPVLATDYSFNEDASEITFTLREGVIFHDGSMFNAEVVKENLDFVRDRENGLARASFFSFIEEVVVNSDYSVTIKSAEPNSAMASYMAHSSASFKPVSQINEKKENPDTNLDRNPIGTGPFVFVEWKDSEHVVVKRNEDYWKSLHK